LILTNEGKGKALLFVNGIDGRVVKVETTEELKHRP
jgi:hypothetical protein